MNIIPITSQELMGEFSIAVSFSVPGENPGFKRNEQLEIWILGIGASSAIQALTEYLSQKRPKFLIISGFAGALDPQIRVGETFLCENVSDLSAIKMLMNCGWQPPPTAELYTAEKLVDTAQKKAALYKTTGMNLVDMESRYLFEIAQSYSIPTITIRAVSDAATMDFPIPEFFLYNKQRQHSRPFALCAYLATHPRCIPSFVSFIKNIVQARSKLRKHLKHALQTFYCPFSVAIANSPGE